MKYTYLKLAKVSGRGHVTLVQLGGGALESGSRAGWARG